jgi:hypothetical protein
VLPPALARPAATMRPDDGRPVPGLLEVTLPWATLTGTGSRPGLLGRIGPVTATQARQLTAAAQNDPAAQWRVIITNAAGQAIAVERVRTRIRGRPARDGPAPGAGLVGRISVVIPQDTLTRAGPGPPGGVAAAVLRTGIRALGRALADAEADAAAGGCAHRGESAGYRPAPRLREFIAARDVTCRNPVCGQPAWRADLDHTKPYDQHGKTCRCNLGGGCRRDHQLKQHPRWKLEQHQPGVFTWTAPGGRTYTVLPDTYEI